MSLDVYVKRVQNDWGEDIDLADGHAYSQSHSSYEDDASTSWSFPPSSCLHLFSSVSLGSHPYMSSASLMCRQAPTHRHKIVDLLSQVIARS
ncbi:hypothetical protein ACLOJK_013107 [Asimina triloba]